MKNPKYITGDSRQSAARRVNEMHWDKEHVPLDLKVGREAYKARTKNRSAQINEGPLRAKVEQNAGKAQVNMPEGYAFQKKEW